MDTLVITLPETDSLRSLASEKYDQGAWKREMNQLNQPLDFLLGTPAVGFREGVLHSPIRSRCKKVDQILKIAKMGIFILW